jgi:hypothetical protein
MMRLKQMLWTLFCFLLAFVYSIEQASACPRRVNYRAAQVNISEIGPDLLIGLLILALHIVIGIVHTWIREKRRDN